VKKKFTYVFLALSAVFVSNSMFAQAPNDDVCNAISLTVGAPPTPFTTVSATAQTSEVFPTLNDCLFGWCDFPGGAGASIWYTFVAPATGIVTVNTCLAGNTYDSQLALWSAGDCNDFSTFTLIGANDDTEGNCNLGTSIFGSTLLVEGLTPGATYYIQVDGFGTITAATGASEIEVFEDLPISFVKLVHNAADTSLALVDIYVDGVQFGDNFPFRNSSGFFSLPSGVDVTLDICDDASVDNSSPLFTQVLNLDGTKDYIAVVSGIAAASGYMPMVPVTIELLDNVNALSPAPVGVDIIGFHGVTDAPTVDALVTELGVTLFDNISYGQFNSEGVINVPSGTYTVQVADQNGVALPGLQYCAQLNDSAEVMIIASGFLNPANNSNGPSFGLFRVNKGAGAFAPLYVGSCNIPANDEPCGAVNLIINNPPTLANNTFATFESQESVPPTTVCQDSLGWCNSTLNGTLWFKFDANETGLATVQTCLDGTTIDTQLGVYTAGDCNDFSTFTLIGANDDYIGGCAAATYASALNLYGLTPGSTYYVQIDGYDDTEIGDFYIQVTSSVGIAEATRSGVIVYPNPAHDALNIANFRNGSATIYNMAGQVVMTERINGGSTLDISALPKGVYQVKLISSTQNEVVKLIKE
jgi:hypothetical protein